MATVMHLGQKFTLSSVLTNSGDGQLVPVLQKPTWTVDNGSIVLLTPSLNGMTCDVKAKASGSCTVTCALTISGTTLTATYSVTVLSVNPDTLSLTASAPVTA